MISAGNRTTGELDLIDPAGLPGRLADLHVSGSAWSGRITSLDLASGDQLVGAGGRVALVRYRPFGPVWTAPSVTRPSVAPHRPVPTSAGVRLLDRSPARAAHRHALPAVPRGSSVYRLGAGFLVASAAGTSAYS